MILVALCFVAVLGIALASYLAVCSRAMQLSNRAFQNELSKQLAEAGLEEGLRAFNKNNWDDWTASSMTVNWDTTTYAADKRAIATISFPSGKFGQGVTAQVKVRVDNYDANTLGVSWASVDTYQINDLVGYAGIWYRSVQNNNTGNIPADSSQNPNLAWWVPAPIPWMWGASITYSQYDVVNYNGVWYRCVTGNTNSAPSSTNANWASIPTTASSTPPISLSWNSTTTYPVGSFIYRSGTWYRCTNSNTNIAPPNASYWSTAAPHISWRWRNGVTYEFNDVVYYNGTWRRCYVRHTVSGSWPDPSNTSYWEDALGGSNTTSLPGAHGWSSSSVPYQVGDCVYYYASSTSQWFRCIKAHTSSTSSTPTDTTYWATTPPYSTEWDPNRQYGQYDQVRYKGIWFLSLQASNTGNLPLASGSSYWAAAPSFVPEWISGQTYSLDNIVSRAGSWYRCILPHSGQAVTNTSYWWPLTGSGSQYVWSPSTSYAAGQYRSYGGAWYKSIATTAAGAGHNPNNTTYWTASWSSPTSAAWGITTGAPVVYAEATLTLGDNTTSRTQLRTLIAPAPLFPNAVAAKTTISIGSSGGTIESYDGSVRASDTNGADDTFDYGEQTNSPFSSSNLNKGHSAIIAAGSAASSAITISDTTTVNGYLSLSTPGTGISSNTTIWGPTSPASPKVDTSRVSRSPYIPNPSALIAASSSASFLNGRALPSDYGFNVSIGTPGGTVPSRYYFSSSLDIGTDAGYDMTELQVHGPALLRINGNLRTRTSGAVRIYEPGSANIQINGYLRTYSGSVGFQNHTKQAKNLFIFSETTTTSSSYLAAAPNSLEFYGAIYFPNTPGASSLGLEVRTGAIVQGALSANEVTFVNEANIRYDTSLRYATFDGVDQPYTVTNWTELSTTEQATMP